MIQYPQSGGFAVLAPFSNLGGSGPVRVGSLPNVTAYGAYDMPGNVREWCRNETPAGRMVRGGAWEDNTCEFNQRRQAPAMDRSDRNGFRLAFYPRGEEERVHQGDAGPAGQVPGAGALTKPSARGLARSPLGATSLLVIANGLRLLRYD